jgi:hypothetical protein
VAADEGAAKSVPPEMLLHQMSGTPACAMKSVPHCCTSALSGEPVEPSARMDDRSPHCAGVMPAFMQLA